jgi:UDP-glucuronate 4-epimerase
VSRKVLVTGSAGFIGSHLAERLVRLGYQVIGLDNFDDYYSPAIKWNNISGLNTIDNFKLEQGDIRDESLLNRIFKTNDIDALVHLAARAGVRPSMKQPILYQDVNIKGTINLLEVSRTYGVKKFVFASSSSVYGLNNEVPFRENDKIDSPSSPYASSKAAAELFCHSYNHLYGLPITVLRFFTVYGPRQRPEMAIHLFTRMIDSGEEVSVFGDGTSKRDYTYIDDIVSGILPALTSQDKGVEIFNLGNSHPIALEYLIHLLEEALGKRARIKKMPMQPGDVPITFAEISKAKTYLGYQPKVTIEEGISLFVKWYCKLADMSRCSSV